MIESYTNSRWLATRSMMILIAYQKRWELKTIASSQLYFTLCSHMCSSHKHWKFYEKNKLFHFVLKWISHRNIENSSFFCVFLKNSLANNSIHFLVRIQSTLKFLLFPWLHVQRLFYTQFEICVKKTWIRWIFNGSLHGTICGCV